jgi:hypothetical protein
MSDEIGTAMANGIYDFDYILQQKAYSYCDFLLKVGYKGTAYNGK